MENLREEILTKAAELFCTYGIKSVSMDDVARELGMSKKTVYQYVKDKASLVEGALDLFKLRQMEKIRSSKTENLNAIQQIFEVADLIKDAIAKFNPVVDYDMRKYYPNLHDRLRNRHDGLAKEIAKENMRRGIEEGLFRPEINVELIAFLQHGRIMELISEQEDKLPMPLDQAIWQTMEYHLRGIVTPKGLKFLEENTPSFINNTPKSEND